MSRSSRKRHNRPERSTLQTHRKIENLRDGLPIARREWHFDERRQFDIPPSKLEFSHDFNSPYSPEYSRVDGRPAIVGQMPRNANNLHMRQSNLSDQVHDYFQDKPELVSECVRRHRRRSVLFALHRTKKGSGAGKKHRWTELSKVRCV